jgi:serine/threonine protein kinase
MIIANKYKINKKLGNGSFGTIFEGENIRTNEKVVIKMEEKTNTLLKHETLIYQYLFKSNTQFIPTLKWFGVFNNYYFIVLNLLGKSLNHYKKEMNHISFEECLTIGKKMIQCIQGIHSQGFIHRDIKPSNFVFDEKREKLYIIDFGFAKKYEDIDGLHYQLSIKKKIIGTPNYISLNLHNGLEPSRRDDLESISYILLFLYLDKLEWTNMELKQMREIKLTILQNNIIPKQFKDFILFCRNLKFSEKPDYNYILDLFSL